LRRKVVDLVEASPGSKAANDAVDSIADVGCKVAVTPVVSSLRATMEVLGADTLPAMRTVRICLGVDDPDELPWHSGHAAQIAATATPTCSTRPLSWRLLPDSLNASCGCA
jgi:hypothetical protein